MNFNLARAYSRMGKPELALNCINSVNIVSHDIMDSLSYWAISTEILEKLGRDKEALECYRVYTRLLESYHLKLFSDELLFSEKKHEMEVENMAEIQKRERTIRWILGVGVILLLMVALIYYRYRMNKVGRLLAEGNAEKLQLESDKQRLLSERFESESRQLRLETEILHLQVGQLEDERERLESLLDSQGMPLSEGARKIIHERIEMLNGLFAQALTDEESYGREFKKYVKAIKKDKEKFQESIRIVLENTHPQFMIYLKEHELTERETGYVCLYAIGLRGKEIGNYLGLARHYNMGSEIRRKLGLDSNSENLGPFIRRIMNED